MALNFDQVFEIVSYAVDQYRKLRSENVSLKEQLATALADDAADEQAIKDAQKAATDAQDRYDAELAKLESLLNGVKEDMPKGDTGETQVPVPGTNDLPETVPGNDATAPEGDAVPDSTVVDEGTLQG